MVGLARSPDFRCEDCGRSVVSRSAVPWIVAAFSVAGALIANFLVLDPIEDQVEFVTLHDMILLDVKSDKITKGDANYKEGWACAMVRPRDAKFVRSDLLPDEHGNTMLACYWTEPLR